MSQRWIHRYALDRKAVCGVTVGLFSTSGCSVTCPDCLAQSKPAAREEVLAQIARAARNQKNN